MADDWVLGIEIGGSKLQLGIGPLDGGIAALERLAVVPEEGAEGIRRQILEVFARLTGQISGAREGLRGIGVGFGGPVDAVAGRTRTSFQIAGWDDFPLADWLREHLGVGLVVVENDADAAGLAEAVAGAGVGLSPILYLTIGSGIGGALIIDGRIYRGAGRGAVEIGHLEIVEPARPRMTLEEIASGWGIAREAQARYRETDCGDSLLRRLCNGDPVCINAVMVAQAAIRGEPLALGVLARAQRALAFALRQAIVLLAPRRIILGGGVSLIGEEHWLRPIRALVDADVFPPFRGSYDITAAALGEEVVVHGALEIARRAVAGERP